MSSTTIRSTSTRARCGWPSTSPAPITSWPAATIRIRSEAWRRCSRASPHWRFRVQTNRQSSAATPRSFSRWISAVALLFAVTAHAALTKETIGKHTCYVYAPEKLAAPAPLLMLFHGSGRDGMTQINEWRKLADKEGIVLAAPDATDTRHWTIPEDGPEFLREI